MIPSNTSWLFPNKIQLSCDDKEEEQIQKQTEEAGGQSKLAQSPLLPFLLLEENKLVADTELQYQQA